MESEVVESEVRPNPRRWEVRRPRTGRRLAPRRNERFLRGHFASLQEELAVVGKLQAELYVSSSALDTDFMVTVSDLTPGLLGSSLFKRSMLR